ncbi:MFS transporter [Promicromonospora sukumoe]|uniref:MFS family permease n=1 Tax=Promicromonospora sukumoe TaxID=88382 RepID=A0A7W3JB43_9MICO|nr:MFS transporter [Promicromonospora sukumoe]MBA8809582.1 MFS family permease [Promicromonospora sukumoe]
MTTSTAPSEVVVPLARNRAFGLLWLGEGVSVVGNATTSALLPLLAVTQLDAGPAWMGLITAAAWLPWLLIGLPVGAWVDRLPARPVMIVANLAAAVSLASVPVAFALGVLTLVQIAVVAMVGGVCTVFFRTAYQVFLPEVVPAGQLEAANARLFGTESAANVAGPGLGGLLAQWLTAALGLALDALTFLWSAVCLWRIRPARAAAPEDGPVGPVGPADGLTARIREGVELVRRDRYLPWFVGMGGASNFGLTGYGALLVLFLVRDLGLTEAGVGAVLALAGAGGVVGAVVAPFLSARLGSGRASTVLLVLSGPTALLVGAGLPGWGAAISGAGGFLVGLCVVSGNVIRNAWRLRYVPAGLRGRVMTVMQVVNFGTMPVAGVAAGWLGGVLGVRETILLMAAVHCLATWSILVSPLARLRELPQGTLGG